MAVDGSVIGLSVRGARLAAVGGRVLLGSWASKVGKRIKSTFLCVMTNNILQRKTYLC